MASKFNIVITVFKTCRRKISILKPELSFLKVKPFGGVCDFSYSGFQIHILFVSLRNFYIMDLKFIVGLITVSRTYIPFIKTKILTLSLENHYIASLGPPRARDSMIALCARSYTYSSHNISLFLII